MLYSGMNKSWEVMTSVHNKKECCLTDMHATLRWRFDFVHDRAVASASADPLDRSEADITKLHAREWLKKVAQSPLSERDLAVEKQVDTALVRLEAWNIARKWYGSNIAGPAPEGEEGWRRTSARPHARWSGPTTSPSGSLKRTLPGRRGPRS